MRRKAHPERTSLSLAIESLDLRYADTELRAQRAQPLLQALPNARIEHLFPDVLEHGRETGLAPVISSVRLSESLLKAA